MCLAIKNYILKEFSHHYLEKGAVLYSYICPKLCIISQVSSIWLNKVLSTGWTFQLRCWYFCAAVWYGMENVPYRPGKWALNIKSFRWESQRRQRCAMPDQCQQGGAAPTLWHSSSSHLLSEVNSQRRTGEKLLKPSVLWIILPANWSCRAGWISEQRIVFSFKSKRIKYQPYPISPTVDTGGFLLTSAELVTALYS